MASEMQDLPSDETYLKFFYFHLQMNGNRVHLQLKFQ